MASNLSNIVFPGQFNPKTDKWCEYKERLLCALDAAGVSAEPADEQKARSLFLSQCGKDTYSLIVSLLVPKRPTSVGFYDILLVLDKFYEPEVNEILEAGKFHKRLQIQGESVQDFVSAISLMAAKCNFVDLKRQLRDRLVLGVRDDRLRRDLLKTTDLTYERAVQLCLNYQAAFHDLYPDTSEMKQTPSSVSEPMDIGRIKSIECRHCAQSHKAGERCPFMKAKCFYCKKFGHIASACMKKSGKVHQVGGDDQPTTPSEDMMGVYVCSDNSYRAPITAELTIDGAKLSMEVDTGASRSIISEETYRKLWQVAPPLQSTNVKLVTWTREPLKVLGVTHVRVVLGNKEAQCELLVVSGKGPSLLGRNWFQALCLDVEGLCWTDDKISRLMSEFPDLFKETLGEYKGPEISLHVRPDAKPRFLKARPVPFPLKKQVEEELNRMVESGVLTPVRYSKWATPLRLVKKDDGALRICGDYRSTVNSAIDVDTYPLTAAVEAFVNLSGGRVFSKLDLKHAYLQMKVDEDTAMLLTLNTPLGLMRMNRLAFGVNSAPGIFQRVMSSALAGMAGVACLLDDVALTGRTAQEHDQRLRAVLQKLTDMGFRLNLKKCVFASNSINFLGHTIDAEGLHPSPEKVREIKEKPAPTNKATLRAFLGLYNFYEKFLPDKATLLEPLYRLLESKRPWAWGDVEQKAFEDAKNLLASDLTLVGYDLNKELLLICDSSEYGLGAVIAHIMEDGSERPVMMASRTLQPHERRYGQIDKEALAIMYGLEKFREFLIGRKFCIITDHKPLVGLFNPDKAIPDFISPRMLRWSLKLGCFDYVIKYRPGKLIGQADALSRWTAVNGSGNKEDALGEVLLLAEQPEGWNLDVTRIATETKKDRVLRKVLFHVLHGWPRANTDPEMQPYWTRREALSHDKDCLLWSNRVIIPQSLQQEVLKLLHEPHAGIVQTKAYARGYVWWAGMDHQIERVVAECEACQAVRNNPPRDPQAWIVPEKPWSRVHVDFAGPFQGKTFIVLIDSYSKWFEAEIIQSMSSGTVISVMRKIFASQGLPDVLVSDNGRAFSSVEFNMFLKKNGIRHLYSPPYHPATNGQIERAIQTFKNKLKKMSESDIPWSEKMPKALYALRTVPNSCTNRSPAEMLNGRKYRTAVSALHPAAAPSAAARQAEAAAHSAPARTFAPAQPVLVRMYQAPDKWQRATVEQVEGPSSYMVRTEDGELHRRHADQMLARAVPTPRAETPPIEMHRPAVSMPSSPSTSDEPIVIPPPDMWPDVIGIPNSC
ncbi:uncharacterized protein K02A2.6-like [Plutella xylostella]|uniref:uncharacterized protein K02A2.6-like n=1 Tax=Plutella xylostella TaxID=51655 RepID=UPI00203251F4|nr:uncharacterized protein K02A2.6-like [Plutella xylostella]